MDHLAESKEQTPRELLPGFYKQYQLNDDGGHSLYSIDLVWHHLFCFIIGAFALRIPLYYLYYCKKKRNEQ